MKRKVIQIADSTQLISLPRKWCIANSIRKGDELEVEGIGDKLTVSCKPEIKIEKADLLIKDYGILAARVIHALYKKGIDEVQVKFESASDAQLVQEALRNETVGYEIVEQDSKSTLVKNISSQIMGFDTMLRRIFLLLTSMAEEFQKHLAEKNIVGMKNLLPLEDSNNRFTTLCRRYINKYGAGNQKQGPLYTIVEEIEKIADEYKYLIKALQNLKGEPKISKNLVDTYTMLVNMIRELYNSFYKLEPKKVSQIAEWRKQIVEESYKRLEEGKNPAEMILTHHALVITQKVFNLVGPILILKSPSHQDETSESSSDSMRSITPSRQ